LAAKTKEGNLDDQKKKNCKKKNKIANLISRPCISSIDASNYL
jgi:hypothetical protein